MKNLCLSFLLLFVCWACHPSQTEQEQQEQLQELRNSFYSCANHDSLSRVLVDRLDTKAYGSNEDYHIALCLLSIQIAYSQGNMPVLLHYAAEIQPLIEGKEQYAYVAADVAADVAYARYKLGDPEEALHIVDSARLLMRTYDSWPSFISYCNCTKRRLSILRDLERYDEMISYAADVLVRLDELERDTTILSEIPDFASVAGLIDFNRGQMYANLCMAYVGLQQAEQVRFWLDLLRSTNWYTHSLVDEQIMDAYAFLGERDELLAAISHIERVCADDTTSAEYAHCLYRRAMLAEQDGDLKLANSYHKRVCEAQYHHIREQEQELLEGFVFFYQHQQEHLEHRHSVDQFRFITAVLSCLVLFLIALVIYFAMRYRVRDTRRRLYNIAVSKPAIVDAEEEEAELEQELETPDASDPVCETSDEVLYARILQIMHDKKLYVNPEFSVQMLAREMGSNRTYISRAINEFAGMNFRSWLCQTRCRIVVSLIKDNPKITTLELMQRTGFSSRTTFYRQFEQYTGLSIDEFRRHLDSDK